MEILGENMELRNIGINIRILIKLSFFVLLQYLFISCKLNIPTNSSEIIFLMNDLRKLGLIISSSEANITISGTLKDSAGNIIPGGILEISRLGSSNIIAKANADTKVYADINGKFSMNIFADSFNIKVSRSDGSFVGSFVLKVTSATDAPEVLSSTGLQISGLAATPVGNGDSGVSSTPVITVSNAPSSITEGKSMNIGIKLSGNVTQNYSITITSSNPSAISVSPSSLTFTTSNFSIDQQIILSSMQDTNVVSEDVKISLEATGLNLVSFSTQTVDDDTMNLSLVGATTVNEGSTATMAVSLTQSPTGNLIVNISSSDPVITISPTSLTFTTENFSTAQNFTLTAVEDANATSENITITASATGVSSQSSSVVAIDNDTTITFETPKGYEGSSVTVPIKLSGNPGISRTINLSSNNSPPTISPSSMTFTNTNFNTSQNLTLTGLTDSNTTTVITAVDSNQSSPTKLITKTWNATTEKYNIGGNVSGLTGNLVLTNKNSYDTVTISGNGNFNFPKTASTYTVVAKLYLLGKVCLLSNLTGIASTLINNIDINCKNINYTLGEGGSGILATGQIISYATGDDGTYQSTLKRSFTDNQDGTVIDNISGLIYQKCSNGQNNITCSDSAIMLTWVNAISYCEGLSLGSRSGWRLPNVNELANLVDYGKSTAPFINNSIFPSTVSNSYWSSSTFAQSTTYAWNINFDNGIISSFPDKTSSLYVRCVNGP